MLGSVETSVVGLSHLFRTSADSNGAQIKKLASFIAKCHENANGMLEILLRRNRNIPADANAVSIIVPNPEDFSQGGTCLCRTCACPNLKCAISFEFVYILEYW